MRELINPYANALDGLEINNPVTAFFNSVGKASHAAAAFAKAVSPSGKPCKVGTSTA